MENEGKKTPGMQNLLDDPAMILFIGVTIYAVFYLIWGVMELSSIPPIPEELKRAMLGGK